MFGPLFSAIGRVTDVFTLFALSVAILLYAYYLSVRPETSRVI
jgi:hypothetical protein